jgi:hypothetical protein
MTEDDLLTELKSSSTDLALLVSRVSRDQLPWVVVPAQAVAAWERREPETWAKVSVWLAGRGVTIVRI